MARTLQLTSYTHYGEFQMKKLLTATLVSLAFAGTATASDFFVDVGVNYNDASHTGTTVNGDTTTGWKDALTLNFDSVSVVTDNGDGVLSVGDTIVSQGGLAVGTSATNFVTALVPGETFAGGPSNNGYGIPNWQLSMSFTNLMGTFTGVDFNYTSGDIDWVLFDATSGNTTTPVHLFTTSISGHTSLPGNQIYTGAIGNFGTDVVNGVSAGDIFNIANGAGFLSFEDAAAQLGGGVRFRIDQNTDAGGLDFAAINATLNNGTFDISGNHDGSMEFSVPEPASVAILGLGLLGFAASRRKA